MITREIEDLIDRCVIAASEARMGTYGGYPDEWRIANVNGEDCVIIASVKYDGAPDLTVEEVHKFLADCRETWLSEDDETSSA